MKINQNEVKVPSFIINQNLDNVKNDDVKMALSFNKFLFIDNFMEQNRIKIPFSRNLLESFF